MSAPLTSLDREGIAFDRAFSEFLAADEERRRRDPVGEMRFAAYRRMITNPFHVKLAIYPENPNPIWAGETWWSPEEGGEDLDQLRADAEARMEHADLTATERANLEAALWALGDFEQGRKDAADERPSYRPSLCG
jgi:hypothetical protein